MVRFPNAVRGKRNENTGQTDQHTAVMEAFRVKCGDNRAGSWRRCGNRIGRGKFAKRRSEAGDNLPGPAVLCTKHCIEIGRRYDRRPEKAAGFRRLQPFLSTRFP